jgi:ribosomal protein L44E
MVEEERKPHTPTPVCKKCGKKQVRVYRYKKLENSKNGKWIPLGWACVECRKMEFTAKGD